MALPGLSAWLTQLLLKGVGATPVNLNDGLILGSSFQCQLANNFAVD